MAAPGLDSRYITGIELEDYFVDKTTGEALAGGKVYFYSDFNRTQGKLVYELTYDAGTGQYSYAALPNPMTLSGVGTFQDAGGNNVAVYYFPFDEFGNEELYYISVYDSNALLQFTRDAWPFPWDFAGGGGTTSAGSITNMLTNPQFTKVNFLTGTTYTITYTGAATTSINLAPGWVLNITHTGAGSATITQTAIAGSAKAPNNPPFALTLVAGANISAWNISQRLSNNPDWAAPQVTGTAGFVASTIMLSAATTGEVSIQYVASAGNAAQTLLQATNTTGVDTQFYNTVELQAANNPDTGLTGFDTIKINIPITGTTGISNVQVVPLQDDIGGVLFEQTPANRQLDLMFNYYKPLLDYKPISSYLTGWDFPLNPTQFLGATVAASAIGANKSKYVWDQTIMFQSANSGIGITRATSGAIKLSAASAGVQTAIIQYLDATKIKDILHHNLSVNVEYKATIATPVAATVSLWYTTGISLPDVSAGVNNSLVLTLDANGKPATFNGAWTEIPRVAVGNTNNALFSMSNNATGVYDSVGFGYWNPGIPLASGNATPALLTDANTATFFAIVVGTGALGIGESVDFLTVSLVPGNIPTIPAPQSYDEVLRECQYYYEQTYNPGIIAGAVTAVGERVANMRMAEFGGGNKLKLSSFNIDFLQVKRATPTMVFYSPTSATPALIQTNAFQSGTAVGAVINTTVAKWDQTVSLTGDLMITNDTTSAVDSPAGLLENMEGLALYHYTADARLGIV